MPARPINDRRQFGKLAVSNGHVGFLGAIRCIGVNDKHMIIKGNKEFRNWHGCYRLDSLPSRISISLFDGLHGDPVFW